jgi:hypothetical protein
MQISRWTSPVEVLLTCASMRGLIPEPGGKVWSAMRVVLVVGPICLPSLYSRAHFLLCSAGRPCGRNWSAVSRLNGSIKPTYTTLTPATSRDVIPSVDV